MSTKRKSKKKANTVVAAVRRRRRTTKEWDGLDPFIVSTGSMRRKHVRALNVEDAARLALSIVKPRKIGMLVEIEDQNGIKVYWDSRKAFEVAGLRIS